ncbi:MAG: hypothetical protein OXC48_02005, partial [Endozoicomonadaceae bacterium]|nr:hypothetical protein [Endozoicomonadaceae bacterium]
SGDTACPAVSKAWPFAMLTEFSVHYPADTGTNTNSLPVTTYNYYRKEINYNGKAYITVLDHQTEQSGKQQLTVTRHYYNNPDDLLTYGLLKQLVLTGKQNETTPSDSVIKDYYYIKSPDSDTKKTYSAIELSENKRLMSSYTTTSLFTNQILMVTDAEKKYSDCNYYDQWDRLIKTERAVGTDFAASVHYDYTLSKNLNQVIITAVNGLQQKVIFDGTGRVLKSFTESIDITGKQQPGHWWPVQKTSYDQYGRIIQKSKYVVDEFGHIQTLNITKDYDDTGRVIRTYLPDGRTTIMHYDDSDRCVVSYQQTAQGERSVISVSKANVLSKPIRQWTLPATTGPLPSVRSFCLNSDKQSKARVSIIVYDGFGRQIITQDPVGRIIRHHYDEMGRLTDTIDPAGNRMHSIYNLTEHIAQSWAYPVSGEHYLLSSSGYNRAGQLIWNAGEDGKRTFYTYTEDGMVATIIKPNQHIFSWRYNLLNLPVSQYTDNKQQWVKYYNKITLKVQKKTDITGTKTYFYSDDGLIQQLIQTGKSHYPDYKLQWKYDNNRRVISNTDISGNKTDVRYDWLGRIVNTRYHAYKKNNIETLLVPAYDNFSRIQHVSYGSGMHRTFHYDSWGRKAQITDIQRKQLISAWSMRYDINGNIVRLSQTAEKKQFAVLYYRYDMLNNLISMQCQGSSGLPLCPHDTSFSGSRLKQAPVIIRQNYIFTPLNRLATVRERLQPTQQEQITDKIINYYYTDTKVPLRLQKISTTWNQHRPNLQNFTYDDTGNMTVDGQNNHITYNALNEVTQVVSSAGKLSNYTYDGGGKEVMEKSSDGLNYLIYCGDAVVNEKIITPEQDTHITGYLGVAKTTDGMISEYYQSSYKGDITGIFRKNHNNQYHFKQRNIYSPYGMVWHRKLTIPSLYQQTLQGFNGERTDPATGWQFLGNGNRTYNPGQRYFLSEDPAGDGYAFGSNNPVMNTDPSGNSPQWLGEAFKWAGYISTLGLSALHQRWANITAAVMQVGCTVATLGAAAAGAGPAVLAGVVTGAAAIGSIPVVAAAIPVNKGLNIAGTIIGAAEMAVSVAAGAIDLAAGMAAAMANNNKAFRMTLLCMIKVNKQGLPIERYVDLDGSISFQMGDSPFWMTVPPQPPLPPLSMHLFKSIFTKSPCYYSGGISGAYLEFTDHNSVSGVWGLLMSSNLRSHIACDTGTILLTYQLSGKRLHLWDLYNFVFTRAMYSQFPLSLTHDHPYVTQLVYVLESAVAFKQFKYHYGPYTGNFLSSIFRHHNGAVLVGYDHITVVEIAEVESISRPMWTVYEFLADGDINPINVTTRELHTKIFPNPFVDELNVNGYIPIK